MAKRMSYRESAAARKEIRQLREQLDRMQAPFSGEQIATAKVPPDVYASVQTAQRLGFVVKIRVEYGAGDTLAFRAIRRGE